MDESTQVTELNNQIDVLNKEHTEYMNYIQTCKTEIATALTNEGVTTSDQETLETMAVNISKVLQARTSDATATAANITEGKTAYINGELITGTGEDNDYYYSLGSLSSTSTVYTKTLTSFSTFEAEGNVVFAGVTNLSISFGSYYTSYGHSNTAGAKCTWTDNQITVSLVRGGHFSSLSSVSMTIMYIVE